MSRCWGCCQENCGYYGCTCSCHDPDDPRVTGKSHIVNSIPYIPTCTVCNKVSCEGTHVLYPCETHKRYQAKRPPRSTCEDCWRHYIKMHPETK